MLRGALSPFSAPRERLISKRFHIARSKKTSMVFLLIGFGKTRLCLA